MTIVADRFWAKVQGGDVSECWQWVGATFGPKGYGQFRVAPSSPFRAHRWAYEALVAAIPDGLQLDHLCENSGCVNPWHLEPVTDGENKRRARLRRLAAGRGYRNRGRPRKAA